MSDNALTWRSSAPALTTSLASTGETAAPRQYTARSTAPGARQAVGAGVGRCRSAKGGKRPRRPCGRGCAADRSRGRPAGRAALIRSDRAPRRRRIRLRARRRHAGGGEPPLRPDPSRRKATGRLDLRRAEQLKTNDTLETLLARGDSDLYQRKRREPRPEAHLTHLRSSCRANRVRCGLLDHRLDNPGRSAARPGRGRAADLAPRCLPHDPLGGGRVGIAAEARRRKAPEQDLYEWSSSVYGSGVPALARPRPIVYAPTTMAT